jgi:serine phosphatase RsbU (regulator of sigma subunit)
MLIVAVLTASVSAFAQKSSQIEKLESLLRLSKTDTSRVNVLNELVREHLVFTPLKAKKYAEESLTLAQKINYGDGVIKSAESLGLIYQNQELYAQATEYYELALKLKQARQDRRGIADSYNRLGHVFVLQNDIPKAIEFYRKSLQIRENLKDWNGKATVLTNLGGAYFRTTNYAEAVNYHNQALRLADSIKNRQIIAINLNRLGESYFQQKNYPESAKCYRQLLAAGQRNANTMDVQRAYLGLSQVYAIQNEYKRAYEYYQFYASAKESALREQQSKLGEEIQGVEHSLESEKHERELIQAQSSRITLLAYALAGAVIVIFAIAAIIFRNNRLTQRNNRLLEIQKQELDTKRIELEEQKTQIETQNESINRKNETLEATFKEIERKNKDITASINYAKRIQESMLATENKILEALPEHFILFRPRDIVSGDFYWFAQRNNRIILAALDCTGHGVPGAIMSMLGDSYLNQIIKLQGITEPQTILNELHENIGIALNQEETKNQDGMDVALCVIDQENKILEYAGASRPLLVMQNGEMTVVESSKLPVGGFQKDRERIFDKHIFNLDVPTTLYIFSDGFQDQFGGPKGRKFSKNRLEELLFEIHQRPMPEQKRILNKTLVDWMGDNRQMDDIMIIGVRV